LYFISSRVQGEDVRQKTGWCHVVYDRCHDDCGARVYVDSRNAPAVS
jgi:hypothetical protein